MALQHSTKIDSGEYLIHKNSDGTWPNDSVKIALLADIRRELRRLNNTLGCSRVVRMADACIRTERRLATRYPLKRKKR